ncbi:MAG: IS1634 family transposase [Chloroflexi bacterium]|nr:IS1634 family transposase [Chloroflexota bacterium]
METAACIGVKQAAMDRPRSWQSRLFDEEGEPEWVEVDSKRVRVERVRDFGGYWLGLQLLDKLGLMALLDEKLPVGREDIPWSTMVLSLVLMRLCEPSSELRIAEHSYERSILGDLLGIPADKVNDDRLYRALDRLLPHKDELEKHLKTRLGELFGLEYELLLYDITSTYFEGACEDNEKARFGYSRDKRSDCKQVCIGLVVSREGMPLGYEVFAGNRADVSTVQEIVEKIERQYGKANRIWVMDRGMISAKTLALLRSEGRRYIVGTPRGQLRQFEEELSSKEGWEEIAEGLSAKLIVAEDGKEWFILCRSEARGGKEKAMLARFEERIEAGLKKLEAACAGEKRLRQATVERRIGALLSKNSRAKGLFKVAVGLREDGGASVGWEKLAKPAQWAALKEGCYLLRTNVEGKIEELWRSYIQLTEAEAAFRIEKGDLGIRPIWHQKEERVEAHILVCFLGYVLRKTLAQMCKAAGLGNEPRKVFDEIAQIKVVDVVMPTKSGVTIRKRCIAQPT